MAVAASLPSSVEGDPVAGAAQTPRREKTPAEVVVMHMRLAAKLGLLASSEPANVARVAANALMSVAWSRGRQPDLDTTETGTIRLLLRAGHAIDDPEAIRKIVEEEADSAPMSVEERGERLAITADERVRARVWMIGANGQSYEERVQEREGRQAARREAYNAARRAKRAAQPKAQKLKDTKPWEAEGVSYRTWRRRQAEQRGQKSGADNNRATTTTRAAKLATEGGAASGPRAAMTASDLSEISASIEKIVEAANLFRERLLPAAEATINATRRIQAAMPPVSQNIRRVA